MPAAATSQIKHITNASTTPDSTVAPTPFHSLPRRHLCLALLFRLKRLEMCQQSDKFRTNYAATTNDDDDDN